jgi:hypothetical protein
MTKQTTTSTLALLHRQWTDAYDALSANMDDDDEAGIADCCRTIEALEPAILYQVPQTDADALILAFHLYQREREGSDSLKIGQAMSAARDALLVYRFDRTPNAAAILGRIGPQIERARENIARRAMQPEVTPEREKEAA